MMANGRRSHGATGFRNYAQRFDHPNLATLAFDWRRSLFSSHRFTSGDWVWRRRDRASIARQTCAFAQFGAYINVRSRPGFCVRDPIDLVATSTLRWHQARR
jgi:hypothetical protein